MATVSTCIFIFCLFLVAPIIASAIQSTLVVKTEHGLVRGILSEDVYVFHNVPFGASTGGSNRFKPPMPSESWDGILDCTTEDPQTLRQCPWKLFGKVLGTEDCLLLHVYIPAVEAQRAASQNETLPVFIFIFGGGFTFGDGFEFGLYDGRALAREGGIIIVSPNYRLNALGYLALPELFQESGTTGNLGLLDQRLAMQWIQNNIVNFNGNSNQVTIGGESAGAISTCWHLAAPQSAGLFHAAILESGFCQSSFFFQNYTHSTEFSRSFLVANGCSKTGDALLECARALALEDVLNDTNVKDDRGFVPALYPAFTWGIALDGAPQSLGMSPMDAFESGNFNKVPILHGTNKDEGTLLGSSLFSAILKIKPIPFLINESSVSKLLNMVYYNETLTTKIINLYSGEHKDDGLLTWWRRSADIITDGFMVCPTRRTLKAFNKSQLPTFQYHFTYPLHWLVNLPYSVYGNYHASELDFVWHNKFPIIGPLRKWNTNDDSMALTFGRFWSNFVKYGNPNGPAGSAQEWPEYSVQTGEQFMFMDVPTSVGSKLRESFCEFWQNVAP